MNFIIVLISSFFFVNGEVGRPNVTRTVPVFNNKTVLVISNRTVLANVSVPVKLGFHDIRGASLLPYPFDSNGKLVELPKFMHIEPRTGPPQVVPYFNDSGIIYFDHEITRTKRNTCNRGRHWCEHSPPKVSILPGIGCTGSFVVDQDQSFDNIDVDMDWAYSYSSWLSDVWLSSSSLPIHQACRLAHLVSPTFEAVYDWSDLRVRRFGGFGPPLLPWQIPRQYVSGIRMMCMDGANNLFPTLMFWHRESFSLYWRGFETYVTVNRPIAAHSDWTWAIISFQPECGPRSTNILSQDCFSSACVEQ